MDFLIKETLVAFFASASIVIWLLVDVRRCPPFKWVPDKWVPDKKMSTVTKQAIALFALTTIFIWLVVDITGFDLYTFYKDQLRSSLFSGFLTVGCFLLSLKTFIIVKLKEDLFDHPMYIKRYTEFRNLNPKKVISLYKPLNRLSDFLIICVIGSILSAALQFTLGFINCCICPSICIASSFVSIVVVLTACWEVKLNLNELFIILEDQANEDYKNS